MRLIRLFTAHHVRWAATEIVRRLLLLLVLLLLLLGLLLLRVLVLTIVLSTDAASNSNALIIHITTKRASTCMATWWSTCSSRRSLWHVAGRRLLLSTTLRSIGWRLLEGRCSLSTRGRHAAHPGLFVARWSLIHGVGVAAWAAIHLLLGRCAIARLLSGSRTAIVRHAHGTRNRIPVVVKLLRGWRRRHAAAIAAVVATLNCTLGTARIVLLWLLLLLWLLIELAWLRARLASLGWLPFLCSVAKTDLTRQNVGPLHLLDTLLCCLSVRKLDEAEAL